MQAYFVSVSLLHNSTASTPRCHWRWQKKRRLESNSHSDVIVQCIAWFTSFCLRCVVKFLCSYARPNHFICTSGRNATQAKKMWTRLICQLQQQAINVIINSTYGADASVLVQMSTETTHALLQMSNTCRYQVHVDKLTCSSSLSNWEDLAVNWPREQSGCVPKLLWLATEARHSSLG